MAPEVISHQYYNHKCDVFSYGILLWELVSGGDIPYSGYTPLQAAVGVVQRGDQRLGLRLHRRRRVRRRASPDRRRVQRDLVANPLPFGGAHLPAQVANQRVELGVTAG